MTAKKDVQDSKVLSYELQQGVASLALEGITLSPESIEDLRLLEAGLLSDEEASDRLFARLAI